MAIRMRQAGLQPSFLTGMACGQLAGAAVDTRVVPHRNAIAARCCRYYA